MQDTLAALESAAQLGTRVSLLMKASSIVLAGCPGHVQQFVGQNQLNIQGSFSRFADDYARRVTVAIDLGHLASDWLSEARTKLGQAVAQGKESSGSDDLLTRRLHDFAMQVLNDLDLAQRTVQQSEESAAESIEMLREAALRADPSSESQATIDGLFKRISRPSPST